MFQHWVISTSFIVNDTVYTKPKVTNLNKSKIGLGLLNVKKFFFMFFYIYNSLNNDIFQENNVRYF